MPKALDLTMTTSTTSLQDPRHTRMTHNNNASPATASFYIDKVYCMAAHSIFGAFELARVIEIKLVYG